MIFQKKSVKKIKFLFLLFLIIPFFSYYYDTPSLSIIKNKYETNLVDISKINNRIIIRPLYASKDNFLKVRLYEIKKLFLLKEVAIQLDSVEKYLYSKGYRLVILDAYRPYSITKIMYELSPNKLYVAHPSKGSNHNRGTSVDATIITIDGKELDMGTKPDEFTGKSDRTYKFANTNIMKNRQILAEAFIKYGFIPLKTEWWHFDFKNAKKYPLLDIPLVDLKRLSEFQEDLSLDIIQYIHLLADTLSM